MHIAKVLHARLGFKFAATTAHMTLNSEMRAGPWLQGRRHMAHELRNQMPAMPSKMKTICVYCYDVYINAFGRVWHLIHNSINNAYAPLRKALK